MFLPVMVRLLQDHPRVGGEKVSEKPTRANCARITPAWAGKSLNSSALKCCVKDHPRVGGEKVMCNSRDGARLGSPPRGRGKAAPRQRAHLARWITPAWAGKSQLKQTGLTMQEDHPRVGGEKMCCTAMEFRSSGSPPRGRGKVLFTVEFLPGSGITPAWAGKRTSPHLYCELSKDHPRVGGEKQNTEQNPTKVRGSPPRGRGKAG